MALKYSPIVGDFIGVFSFGRYLSSVASQPWRFYAKIEIAGDRSRFRFIVSVRVEPFTNFRVCHLNLPARDNTFVSTTGVGTFDKSSSPVVNVILSSPYLVHFWCTFYVIKRFAMK